jgi:hypothetical protein
MKKLITTLVFSSLCCAALAQTDSPFKLERLQSVFERMRSNPSFDVSKPIQWGFFFRAATKEHFVQMRKELESQGYIYVEEHQDRSSQHWLQLSKIEIHNPDSLHALNNELFIYAKKFSGVIYDGWDVTRQPK